MSLGEWGLELYRSVVTHSKQLEKKQVFEGMISFVEKGNSDDVVLTLEEGSIECSCRFWKAYRFQCSHLFVLHGGFHLSLCAPRWRQFKELESAGAFPVDASNCAHPAVDDDIEFPAVEDDDIFF